MDSRGQLGMYWSRMSVNSYNASALYFYTQDDSIDTYYSELKSRGSSIRCITPPYIQGNVTSWCSAQTTPAAFTSGTTINANVSETEMVDARDGERYKIRKLADGHCWMVENLRLGKIDRTYVVDSNLSDVPSGTSFILPATITSGWNNDNVLRVFSQDDGQVYGNYYNWYTATAKSGTLGMTSGDAAASICPNGMKISPISGNGSYASLTSTYKISYNAIGATNLQGAPFGFHYAGYYYGELMGQNSRGYYWSRTVRTRGNADVLTFDASLVYPYSDSVQSTRHGLPVRCITP